MENLQRELGTMNQLKEKAESELSMVQQKWIIAEQANTKMTIEFEKTTFELDKLKNELARTEERMILEVFAYKKICSISVT